MQIPELRRFGLNMAIEFVVKLRDLAQAFTFVRPSPLRTRQAHKEFVDVYARKSEIELASKGAASSFPAQVINLGHARVPIWFFEWFSKAARTLRQPSVRVSIADGEVRAENLTYSHSRISVHSRV